MADQKQNPDFLQLNNEILKSAQRYSHKAMGTLFEIFIINDDPVYGEQAAEDAFLMVNRIEQSLSHYIENSDISKIGSLQKGESTRVGIDTMESLLHCSYLFQLTDGLFDITIGPLYKAWLNEDKSLRAPSEQEIDWAKAHVGMNYLILDPDNIMVSVQQDSLSLDLGGYGKGYAVDRIAELLGEWEIDNALIHSGFSSLYAIGKPDGLPGWPVTLSHPVSQKQLGLIYLSEQGMSASGIQKGRHIINPKTAKPVDGHTAVWTLAEDAATADALSTAFMMMDFQSIERLCKWHKEFSAYVISGEASDFESRSLNFPQIQK